MPNGKAEAQEGCHDDLVMGLAIAHYIRPQQKYTLLNNQNINEPSKYKKYVAEIDNQHLEDWYDELYQMMLLALLLLDNIERQKSINELKEKVAGK